MNLCKLTEDVLPLYADDLLSAETRRAVEEHAAGCATCRELLASAGAPLPPASPPAADVTSERAARRFFGRLRRWAFYGAVSFVILLVFAASLGYQFGRLKPWELAAIPLRVESADDLARRVVPGWARAEVHDLIVPLSITERIPHTNATVTWERAWYSGQQVYILYTMRAPADKYIFPTWTLLGPEGGKGADFGDSKHHRLREAGGFSSDAFHGVIAFPRFDKPPVGERLALTVRQWGPVSPEKGLVEGKSALAGEVTVMLPWKSDYLREPPPEVFTLTQRHTWLGRTLALERLEVGTGRIQLNGLIELPTGEIDPHLLARLHVGQAQRQLKEFKAAPTGQPDQYRFTAFFDGPDSWPVPIEVELSGISFMTDQTLEWSFPWAKYKNDDPPRTLEPSEQVSIKLYDSTLRTIYVWSEGVGVEMVEPQGKPPYVRASLRIGGTGIDREYPGMEVTGPGGEVISNMGGGGGTIWHRGDEQLQGVAARWDPSMFPHHWETTDALSLRYVHPEAALVLEERWTLVRGPSKQ